MFTTGPVHNLRAVDKEFEDKVLVVRDRRLDQVADPELAARKDRYVDIAGRGLFLGKWWSLARDPALVVIRLLARLIFWKRLDVELRVQLDCDPAIGGHFGMCVVSAMEVAGDRKKDDAEIYVGVLRCVCQLRPTRTNVQPQSSC